MKLGFGLGLTKQQGGIVVAPDTWAAAIAALATTTKDWALDPTKSNRVWDDSARTVPMGSPPAQIAAIDSDSNVSGYLAQNSSTSFEPVWNGRSLQYDGLDDYLSNQAGLTSTIQSWLNGVSACTFCTKFRVTSLAAVNTLLNHSTTASATASMFMLNTTVAGEIALFMRRVSGDAAGVTFTTSGLSLQINTDYLLTFTCDYVNGPVNLRINGASANSGTFPGTSPSLGSTTASDSLATRMGRTLSNTNPASAYVGRTVGLSYLASAGQITTLEAAVNYSSLI